MTHLRQGLKRVRQRATDPTQGSYPSRDSVGGCFVAALTGEEGEPDVPLGVVDIEVDKADALPGAKGKTSL